MGKLEGDAAERAGEPGPLIEAGRDPAVGEKLGDIDILGDPVRIAANRLAVAHSWRLREQPAVLGDQAVTAEDQVGRRFRRARAGVCVGRDASARLADHQVGAVLALADGLVAGREVEQHRRPGLRLDRAGRDWHPEVLADLDAHDHGSALASLTREEQVNSERNASARKFDRRRLGTVGRTEPSALVELLVVGKDLLGHDPQDLSVRQDRRGIEQAVLDRHRQPDYDELLPPFRRPGNAADLPESSLEEGRLAEQIGAGVAREAKLGEQDDVAVLDLVQNPDDLRGIGLGIGNGGPDRDTGHANETESVHRNPT